MPLRLKASTNLCSASVRGGGGGGIGGDEGGGCGGAGCNGGPGDEGGHTGEERGGTPGVGQGDDGSDCGNGVALSGRLAKGSLGGASDPKNERSESKPKNVKPSMPVAMMITTRLSIMKNRSQSVALLQHSLHPRGPSMICAGLSVNVDSRLPFLLDSERRPSGDGAIVIGSSIVPSLPYFVDLPPSMPNGFFLPCLSAFFLLRRGVDD